MRISGRIVKFGLVFALLALFVPGTASAQGGFAHEPMYTDDGLDQPWDLAFVEDDGGLVVIARCGKIHYYAPDGTRNELADISARVDCTKPDAGLIGVAAPTDLEADGHLYVYFTVGDGGIAQRVSRFPLTRDGDTLALDAGAEQKLHDELPFNLAQARNAGGIAISGDSLYVGVGDNGQDHNVQDPEKPHGKIWKSTLAGKDKEVFALGLGRPYRIAWDDDAKALWVGDQRDTIKGRVFLATGGENFGWPAAEGDITAPIYEYSGKGVVVGAPYNPADGAPNAFPPNLHGAVPVADYQSNTLTFLLTPDWTPYETTPGATSIRAIATHPDGSMWFVEQAPGKNVVSRILWADEPPAVTISKPSEDARYSGGQTLELAGSAEDPVEGELKSGFEWQITLFDGEDNEVDSKAATGQTAEYKTPEDVDIQGRLEITLTVKDSVGSAGQARITLLPESTKVTWGTDPEGVEVTVDGEVITETTERTYAAGTSLDISVPIELQFESGGELYTFRYWGDGTTENELTWTVPNSDVDMTALFLIYSEPTPGEDTGRDKPVEPPPAFVDEEPGGDGGGGDDGCASSTVPGAPSRSWPAGALLLVLCLVAVLRRSPGQSV